MAKREEERAMVENQYMKELLERVAAILNVDIKAVSNMTLVGVIEQLAEVIEHG